MRSRQKIVDATLRLIGSSGFEGVNVAAVAHEAAVSRQTVYSIFGTKEDLVSHVVAEVAVDVIGTIKARSAEARSTLEYIVELFVASREAMRDDPVLTALLLNAQGNPVFDTGMIARAKPITQELVRPALELEPRLLSHADDIYEYVLRLGLSVILFDDDALHTDDELRSFVQRWLGPGLAAITESES